MVHGHGAAGDEGIVGMMFRNPSNLQALIAQVRVMGCILLVGVNIGYESTYEA
jgi:hypothetical protein